MNVVSVTVKVFLKGIAHAPDKLKIHAMSVEVQESSNHTAIVKKDIMIVMETVAVMSV